MLQNIMLLFKDMCLCEALGARYDYVPTPIFHRAVQSWAVLESMPKGIIFSLALQDYWAGKAQRHAEYSEQMRRNLYTMPEDMARNR